MKQKYNEMLWVFVVMPLVKMKFELFSKVRYIGPKDFCDELSFGDVGYVIEIYERGNYEVEFLLPDGSAKALLGVPRIFLEHIEVP
jgi:hypothetical protein